MLLIGEGVIPQVAKIFKKQFPGAQARIVADKNTFAAAGQAVRSALSGAGLEGEEPLIVGGDAQIGTDMEHVETIVAGFSGGDEIPVAVGAGTINDLVKLAAERLGRGYMVVATAASMDGYTAYGASITSNGNKQTEACRAPRAVVADIEVLRHAPRELTAAGYSDLMAKLTSGADWIIADALGVEPIDAVGWAMVQDELPQALANPEDIVGGSAESLRRLVNGLMQVGYAMEHTGSSRVASGAEHQFSHLWDMENHTYQGVAPLHGYKVGVATCFVAEIYERLLEWPVAELDVAEACAKWPEGEAARSYTLELFAEGALRDLALRETAAKAISRKELALELERFKQGWPELRERLRKQLLPAREIKRRLQAVGAPVEPEQIGISRERLMASVWKSQQIRRRYTVLDLCLRAGILQDVLQK